MGVDWQHWLLEGSFYISVAYGVLHVFLIPISLILFMTAFYIIFFPEQRRYLGYQLDTHGNRYSLVATLLFSSMVLLGLDNVLNYMVQWFDSSYNPANQLNFGDIAAEVQGVNPLVESLHIIGYLLYTTALYLLVRGLISGRPKSITYNAIGAAGLGALATGLVIYQ